MKCKPIESTYLAILSLFLSFTLSFIGLTPNLITGKKQKEEKSLRK